MDVLEGNSKINVFVSIKTYAHEGDYAVSKRVLDGIFQAFILDRFKTLKSLMPKRRVRNPESDLMR